MSPTFASLRYPNYRLWFAGALLSNTGTWMQRVAQDWLVLTRLTDESGVAVGVVTALQFLPTLLLSAWAGVLADRLPRRALLIATQLAQGALALGLGALVLSGRAELWHVYVFALLLGVVSAFDGPVRQIFVAELVPADKLPNAVGLNSASFNAARLIGPGLAGLLIAWVGSGWVFVINGVSYAATILALAGDARLRAAGAAPGRRGQAGPAARGAALRAGPLGHRGDHGRDGRGVHLRAQLPAHLGDDGPHRVRQGRGGVRDPRLDPGDRLAVRRAAGGPARASAGAAGDRGRAGLRCRR